MRSRSLAARSSAAVATVCLVGLAATAPAAEDQLVCFKVKAPAAFDAATVDLESSVSGFDLSGCTVKSKAAQVCVPAGATVVSIEGGTFEVVGDEATALQRVCYKLKCPVFAPSDVEMTDGFGTGTLSALKPAVVCTPATAVEATTTTTTTTTTVPACIDSDGDGYGANCVAGADCDDANGDRNPGETETCNGLEDDCDGFTDESDPQLGASCATGSPGICAAGTLVCDAGELSCSGTPPATETCNSEDDDCDGTADEGVTAPCYSGPPGTEGVASCKAGTQTCSGGVFGTCTGEVLPQPEFCNNADEDCDGEIDNDLTRTCYTGPAGTAGVGACKAGTQTCSAGSWGSGCPGQVTPVTENCSDALDNDCDGMVNEGC